MKYLVHMDVDLPPEKPAGQAAEPGATEAACSQELQRAGKWPEIWRVVGGHTGDSVLDVDSPDELHEILQKLPLFPYADITVVPLARHPSGVERSAAPRAGAVGGTGRARPLRGPLGTREQGPRAHRKGELRRPVRFLDVNRKSGLPMQITGSKVNLSSAMARVRSPHRPRMVPAGDWRPIPPIGMPDRPCRSPNAAGPVPFPHPAAPPGATFRGGSGGRRQHSPSSSSRGTTLPDRRRKVSISSCVRWSMNAARTISR
ncbi:muconolactone Delta-isomerase family protein [Kocuria sabuli]|uniref:muconolactone Delta-isomerase family protein n=1 Tax=Kocuria sabuli TaxID=3071448 RepID=UPI0034D9D76E